MRRVVAAVLWLAVGLGGGWAYKDHSMGLVLEQPQGWKQSTSGQEVRFEPPAADPRGWAVFSIRSAEAGEVSRLDREVVLDTTRTLAARLRNFQLVGTKSLKVGGTDAHMLSYTATQGQVKLHTTQVFLVRSGRLLVFSMSSPPAHHAQRRKDLDKSLGSVRWSP